VKRVRFADADITVVWNRRFTLLETPSFDGRKYSAFDKNWRLVTSRARACGLQPHQAGLGISAQCFARHAEGGRCRSAWM